MNIEICDAAPNMCFTACNDYFRPNIYLEYKPTKDTFREALRWYRDEVATNGAEARKCIIYVK